MCNEHVGILDYWPLVLNCKEVSSDDYKEISDKMFIYYHEKDTDRHPPFNLEQIDTIGDSDFVAWFAFDKAQFKIICSFATNCRLQQVAIFLCKLRTALSNEKLGFLFGVSRETIRTSIQAVIEDLTEKMVPAFINTNDRSTLLSHKTPISSALFEIGEENGCVIFDATYRVVQKSQNFSGQKELWSEQKKMPLNKPMVGCAPDGYILFVLGPYDAKHNDAAILKDCFNRYDVNTIKNGDTILVDRGFRDALPFLKEKGLKVYCPGLGQLNTNAANESRFVTKVRWVIEQVFGRLKMKFKLFAIPAQNSTLCHDYKSLVVACALLNLFHSPILSDTEHEDIAAEMKRRSLKNNNLNAVVEEHNLTQVRAPYHDIEYTALDNADNNQLLNFPQLSKDDLFDISLGKYQIKNAVSYYAEHLKEGIFLVQKFEPNRRHRTANIDFRKYGIEINKPLLIKALMKSRFRGGKQHYIFILLDNEAVGRQAISEYYCTCESGSRTVGCCSHIMAIIWYLGWGQYNGIHLPNPTITKASITIPKNAY